MRVCAATYDKTPVEQEGIHVLVSDGSDSFYYSLSCLNCKLLNYSYRLSKQIIYIFLPKYLAMFVSL